MVWFVLPFVSTLNARPKLYLLNFVNKIQNTGCFNIMQCITDRNITERSSVMIHSSYNYSVDSKKKNSEYIARFADHIISKVWHNLRFF